MRARAGLGLAAALALAAGLAHAAPPRASQPASAGPDVFGGYSYTQAGEAGLHGVGFSGSYALGPALGLVLDLSGHTGSFAGADLDQLGVLGGARWTPSASRLRPFAEALIGGVRTSASVDLAGERVSDSDWDWGVALGGGADFTIEGRWSARAVFHLRLLSGEGAWDTDPRLALGVAYRLGR